MSRGQSSVSFKCVKFENPVRHHMQVSVGDFGCRNLDLKGEI